MDNNTPPTTPPIVDMAHVVTLLRSVLDGTLDAYQAAESLDLTQAQIDAFDVHTHLQLFTEPYWSANGPMEPLDFINTLVGLHWHINNN